MKRLFVALCITLFFIGISYSAEITVGVVDMERIFREYNEFQEAKRELDRFVLEWERQRDSLKQYIDSLKTALEVEKPGLTEKGREKKEIEIVKAQETYSQLVKSIWDRDGLFYKKSTELLNPYYEKIQETIKNVANANKLDFVFNSSGNIILYASNSQNITDLVLQELNKTYEIQRPQVTQKFRLAIFPLMETESEAQKLQLGSRLQRSLYQGLSGSANFELLSTGEVNQEISRRSLSSDKLFPENCQQIALSLNSDFFVAGTVETQGENVTFTYRIFRTATMEKLVEITGQAQNPRESLDVESIQKAKLLDQQFKP
ncbi:MAG: OmpH family outer membrane protein [Candidatus Hydrothermia bacterium]